MAENRSTETAADKPSSDPGKPAGQGFLRAVLWGDVFVSLALLLPALDYYQTSMQPYAVAGIFATLAVEVWCLRMLRQGTRRAATVLLCLAGLFSFYAVHNFVWLGMTALRPTWYGVVFTLAGGFFAWAAVGLLRLWARL